jgi:phenylacetate-CoA ligase
MSEKRYWDESIETLPRPKLITYQIEQLRRHLELAWEKSPYYRQAFESAGVKPSDLRHLEDLRRFPFVNKAIERDRQVAHPLLGDMTAASEEEIVFVAASSGSTGVPTFSPFTQEDFDEFQDVEARLFWGTGMRPHDRYMHALNFTLFVGGPDVIGAQKLGALCIWAGSIPSERLLFIMKSFQPTTTWTTPSYAWYLGETAKQQGLDPARDLGIRRIIVAGEPGGSIPATRAAIEGLWNAKLYDFYGISDIFGACAGMCSEHDGLHLAEDHILLEVVDPESGEPVEDGTPGEMVLTTLRKRARPMIRFRTGDIVQRYPEGCSCGRTHVRFSVIGRRDDMIIISGVNVFPSDIEYVARNVPGLTGEYRIVVYTEDHLTRFDVEVERSGDFQGADEDVGDEVKKQIASRLGVRPRHVKVLAAGALPRATHKAKRLVDLRGTENIRSRGEGI